MENDSQVCAASCFRGMDPEWTSGKSLFLGTWQAVADVAEAEGAEERERTIEKGCFVWEVERDAKKCQEEVGRKEMKAKSIDICFSLLVKQWMERNKVDGRFKRRSVSKEHFLSYICFSSIVCLVKWP